MESNAPFLVKWLLFLWATMLSSCTIEYVYRNLISKLNQHFNFDPIIFVLDTSVDRRRFIDTTITTGTPQSLYTFEQTDDENLTELEVLREVSCSCKNTFMVVAPKSAEFEKNEKLLVLLKETQVRLQINMKIGFFLPNTTSKANLNDLFRWSWKHRMINS